MHVVECVVLQLCFETSTFPNKTLLCIYSKDGTKATTRIKKVSGDTDLFLKELRSVLQIPESKNPRDEKIRVRTGGTIEVDGNHVRDVKVWLTGLGF